MKAADDYAKRAARRLREARAHVQPRPARDPEAAIAQLAGIIGGVAARRRRRMAGAVAGMAAAFALVVALVAVRKPSSGMGAGLSSTAASPDAHPGFVIGGASRGTGARAWNPGDRLQSADDAIELTAADGTSVALAPHSQLSLLRADGERWLRLNAGAVGVHVAKLQPGERFVIVTPDAEVEVRGTRFHVTVAPLDERCVEAGVTRVAVDEGVVVVRTPHGEARVGARERWPADCPTPAAAPETERRPPPVTRAPAVRRAPPPSTLATENDLFAAALRAERAGDRRGAVQLFDVLLNRFPQSPLRESAAEARVRLMTADRPTP